MDAEETHPGRGDRQRGAQNPVLGLSARGPPRSPLHGAGRVAEPQGPGLRDAGRQVPLRKSWGQKTTPFSEAQQCHVPELPAPGRAQSGGSHGSCPSRSFQKLSQCGVLELNSKGLGWSYAQTRGGVCRVSECLTVGIPGPVLDLGRSLREWVLVPTQWAPVFSVPPRSPPPTESSNDDTRGLGKCPWSPGCSDLGPG